MRILLMECSHTAGIDLPLEALVGKDESRGTAFWIDRKEQMVVVWMTQGQPGPWRGEDRDLFRQLVQAAIVD